MAESVSSSLCRNCGLCCNGVIFADVKVQPPDDAETLKELGLPISATKSAGGQPKWPQPCAALDGCHCRIYAERPHYCREFECSVLKRVLAGKLEPGRARKLIRKTLDGAEQVKRFLRALGDSDEHRSLAGRFRRLAKRMESCALTEETADQFARLTLAVHDLNLVLSQEFYPGRPL